MRPDFSRMGSVALVGAFTGIDVWDGDARGGGGAAVVLDTRNAWRAGENGRVDAVCVMRGVTYLGGTFGELVDGNGTQANAGKGYVGVAAWDGDGDGGALRALGQGINGSVRALFCDEPAQLVYVGGAFSSPVGSPEAEEAFKGNVVVWDVARGEWRATGFGGVDGDVDVIARGREGEVLFGGKFVTQLAVGNVTALNTTTTTSNTTGAPIYLNTSTSSLPSSPLGTLGTQDSPYLLPIPLLTPQSAIDAGPSSSDPSHADPRQLLCAAGPGGGWWVRDGSVGKVTVNLYRSVRARGVRLGNTVGDGRGTTRFR